MSEGWNHYRLGEFDSAVRSFTAAREVSAAATGTVNMAQYGLATTWNLRTPLGDQDKALARKEYQQVIDRSPDSDLAAWSLLALARMQHVVAVGEEPDYEAVRAAYRTVIQRFPNHLAGHEAFIYLQSTLVQTVQPGPTRQAEIALRDFIQTHPRSGFISAAWSLLASCYETLGRPEEQLAAEMHALESMEFDPTNPLHENSVIYWRIATIAEFEAGDFATARTFYRRLVAEYPQDIRVYACEEALRRMDRTEAELRGAKAGPTS